MFEFNYYELNALGLTKVSDTNVMTKIVSALPNNKYASIISCIYIYIYIYTWSYIHIVVYYILLYMKKHIHTKNI
jgi:hypothetical protein